MDFIKKKTSGDTAECIAASDQIYYYNVHHAKAMTDFTVQLKQLKKYIHQMHQTPIFLCIGSDRATGDCFGPIVGQKLLQSFSANQSPASMPIVYGTLHSPVHAVNLASVISQIQSTFYQPFVIAVDASLGIRQHIGYITLGTGPLFPGIGVKKDLPHIGNAAITGIVNIAGSNSHTTLQTTHLSTVVELSNFVVNGITTVFC
jgi:putative sporulation protein YyaC